MTMSSEEQALQAKKKGLPLFIPPSPTVFEDSKE
jgi:hypothetical protein